MLFSVQYNTGPGEQFEVYDDCLVFDIYDIVSESIRNRLKVVTKSYTFFLEKLLSMLNVNVVI